MGLEAFMKFLRTKLLPIFFRCFLFGGLITTFIVGIYYAIFLLQNFRIDTTSISNTAFAFATVLAALCFSWAQALPTNDKDRKRITFAGERLFHAVLFLLIASIVKYAALSLGNYNSSDLLRIPIDFVRAVLGILSSPLFLFAVSDAYAGILVIYKLLWPRTYRYPEWDIFV